MKKEAQDIFAAAYERPQEEREAFLADACENDKDLRKEVDQLLTDAERADSFFGPSEVSEETDSDATTQAFNGEPSPSPLPRNPGSGSPVRSSSVSDVIPTKEELEGEFPELEIVELLGRGGMGAVFKARQESLDRFVAVKVLPANWNEDESFRERFEREAKTLAALNHPNIVTIHDFGERNGRFYFTMEYVDGTDLGRMIKDGEMKPEQALSLIPQICEAIQFAHDKGVVHRDIKPGNILVGRDGRIKVADFGIAKLGRSPDREVLEEGEDIDQGSDLTGQFGVLGTPRYMAPEQAEASSGVDHRADLYALGVVFYEMLVGSTPAKEDLLVPPSRQVGGDRRWDRIVMRALEVDPNRRYQNATEIKTAVESVLADQARLIPGWLKVLTSLIVVAFLSFFGWRTLDTEKKPMVNSLGMEFVPVEGVEGLVSVWETRVRDYEEFVKETERTWKSPVFTQTPDHPAVHVSWHEARAFCEWLTKREREAGNLKEGERYRLPTDLEWSAMAGLTDETGGNPRERHRGQSTVFPWGEATPIPDRAGNYPDETGREVHSSAAVEAYRDGFPATAPVGSFPPTQNRLHDLGGNIWEWTESAFSPDDGHFVLRGGSWWASEPEDGWKSLLASHRRANVEATGVEEWDVGFRVVRGPEPAKEEADLFTLILRNKLNRVQRAIEQGTKVNAANRAGQVPIVLAAESGNLEMVKVLHKAGAGLDSSDRRGRTALHAAAEIGDTKLIAWLLEQGAKPRTRTVAGEEPFLLAVPRAPVALLEKLLAAAGQEVLTVPDSRGKSPLSYACQFSPDETVRWLIGQLGQENIENASEFDIMTWGGALAGRDSSLLTKFLAKASPWIASEMYFLPAMHAVNFDREENFSLLLEGAGEGFLNEKVMESIGRTAVAQGRPWALKILLANGWDPKDERGGRGENLLVSTTGGKRARDSVRGLIEEKASSKDRDSFMKFAEQVIAMWPPPATRESIRILVEAGVDLEGRDRFNRTPLIEAAMKGNFDALETFLDLGSETEAKDNMGFTPLLCAIEDGNLRMVKTLEKYGADFSAVNTAGLGALHLVGPHDEVLQYLLGKNLELEAKAEGNTPLTLLSYYGYEKAISLFIEAGADVNAVITEGASAGQTVLHRACFVEEKTYTERAKREREADLNLGREVTLAFPLASREERIRAIKLLVEAGANPKAKDAGWATPLHFSAKSGLPEIVELFLQRGTNPNALSRQLGTPLFWAAWGGNLECTRILLDHKAVADNPIAMATVTEGAIQGQNPEVLALLLKHKAPVDRRYKFGDYPIHNAASNGQLKMVELLLDAGADIEARDFQYRTPLHSAASRNQLEMIELLWKRGARIDAADMFSDKASTVARANGHLSLSVHIDSLARQPLNSPKPAINQPAKTK